MEQRLEDQYNISDEAQGEDPNVVSKLTGECRTEMKRIDAEMARLVDVEKESREAFP